MEKFYYHITDVKNIERILTEGLPANEAGEIFLFENVSFAHAIPTTRNGQPFCAVVARSLADILARDLFFMDKYALLEISAEGIEGELINDGVTEFAREQQWIAQQPLIAPEHIRLFKEQPPRTILTAARV